MPAATLDEQPRIDRIAYSYAEADRIARVSRGTAKRWITGYHYTRDGRRRHQPSVTSGAFDSRPPGISFAELIEVAAIARLRQAGLSTSAIRAIVDQCREAFNTSRPLAELRFMTDGRETFVQVNEEHLERVHGVTVHDRQRAWSDVLAPFLTTVDYQDGVARRWWPDGRDAGVMVDPEYGFGAPVVEETGIRTEILIELFQAGESPERIAQDFSLTPEQVLHAIRFESKRRPAIA